MSTYDIPRIPLNLREHKRAIAISWTILFIGGCVIPILLYFILKDVAHLKEAIVLGVPTGIFGVTSLLSYFQRLWSLAKKNSISRPIGGSRWALDFFHWNFTFGFCLITALIAYSTANVPPRPRVVALPLSLLMLQVCSQILLGWALGICGFRYPFRFSSLPRGDVIRPAIYTIVEDVVAVDGKQGTAYRVSLNQAYEERQAVRTILYRLDLLWGFSGMIVGGVLMGVILGIKNTDVAWCIGWAVPWAWAAICAILSIAQTKSLCRIENQNLKLGTVNSEVKSGTSNVV